MSRVAVILLSAVAMLLNGTASRASLVLPDVGFSFAPPLSERGEVVELVSAALIPLGFGPARVSNVRTDGFFRVSFSEGSNKEVSLVGSTSCVTVSIYTSQVNKSEELAAEEAQQIMDALLAHLRSAAGDKLLLFRSDTEKRCTHAL